MTSHIPLAAGLTFKWAQTAGPTITLSGANTVNATFTAPTVTAATAFTFTFTATSSAGSSTDTVVVTVNPATLDVVSILAFPVYFYIFDYAYRRSLSLKHHGNLVKDLAR